MTKARNALGGFPPRAILYKKKRKYKARYAEVVEASGCNPDLTEFESRDELQILAIQPKYKPSYKNKN